MYTSLFVLVLMTAQTLYRPVRSESVSLTVEGGVSLVGPHCPGTVRLFCEGVDLTSLGWTYNGIIDITEDSFFSDDSNNIFTNATSNPAFVSVLLTAVVQNSQRLVLANFSSILTVDLSQLQQHNVMSISCGDQVNKNSTSVSVHIIQETAPGDPQLTQVKFAAILEADEVNSANIVIIVSVLWEKVHKVRTLTSVIVTYMGCTL